MNTWLDTDALAARWGIAPRTLERWRHERTAGPPFSKIGRAVRYALTDVEAFEAARKLRPVEAATA
jgi:N-acyl-D-aspartate/D-glutamate deacylase